MTTMNHPIGKTAITAILFWTFAAAAIAGTHMALDRRSPAGAAATTIGALLITAFCYTRLAGHDSITHALGVGITWLVLAIVTEMLMTTHLGHGWYALLGSPDRPLLRNVFLFAWIFAPALFAKR
jgi:hypothetical protein